MKKTVLFLCDANGVQSIMAAALLRRIDPEHFEAVSASIRPGQLHPLAVETMKEVGVNLEEKISAPVGNQRRLLFDFVITLCDRTNTDCTGLRGEGRIHWHFDDPLRQPDLDRQRRAFRALRDQIAQRLHLFVLVQIRSRQAA
jgi:protein-tyrosine-phosphatase